MMTASAISLSMQGPRSAWVQGLRFPCDSSTHRNRYQSPLLGAVACTVRFQQPSCTHSCSCWLPAGCTSWGNSTSQRGTQSTLALITIDGSRNVHLSAWGCTHPQMFDSTLGKGCLQHPGWYWQFHRTGIGRYRRCGLPSRAW